MRSPKVALFGNHGSSQVLAIRDAVEEAGGTPLVFDIQLGGDTAPLMRMDDTGASWDGVNFADVHAVHIRCTAPNTLPALPPLLNAASFREHQARYLREQELQAVTMAFFDHLVQHGRLVVNPLTSAYIDHDTKAQLYQKLRAQGFPAPATIMTNDPGEAMTFIRRHGEAVVKPAIGVGSTRVVTLQDEERLEDCRLAPVLMQERIEGNTLRIHIVGDQVVLALRIISEGGVDSRTNTKEFQYIRLADEEEAMIVRANRMLGLHYAAWDVIRDEEGRLFYLDCNPGPFVMWIGAEMVKVVFRQLARYLVTFARTRSVEEAGLAVVPWRPAAHGAVG